MRNKLQLLTRLSSFYFKEVWKEIPFVVIMVTGLGLMAAYIIIAKGNFEAEVLPSTYEVMDVVRGFAPVLMALMALYCGELLARDRVVKISPLLEVLPYANGFRLTSQIVAMAAVLCSVLILLMITGLSTQIILGFHDFSPGLYLSTLFTEILFNGLFMIVVAAFIHTLINHKFVGHAVVILLIITQGYLSSWGLEHRLYHYGRLSLGQYSDLIGFQANHVKAFVFYTFYWLGIGIFLYQITRVLIVRGIETGFRMRWKLAHQRFRRAIPLYLSLGLILALASGANIYVNTSVINEFQSRKDLEKYKVAYEKSLKKYEGHKSPEIVAVKLDIDLFPSEEAYTIDGTYGMINTGETSISEIIFHENLSANISTQSVNFNQDFNLKEARPEFKFSIYELAQPLKPGDSLQLSFKMRYSTEGFAQKRRQYLPQTPSFFTNDQLPELGYKPGFELKGTPVRARYQLAPRRRERERNDPEGYTMGLHHGHNVMYEAHISTEKGQWATTSGDLIKQWTENDRAHFHYKTPEAIENQFVVITGALAEKTEYLVLHKDSVKLSLFHHPSHTYNLEEIMHGMRASVDLYSNQFSPYQYSQLNLLEVPRLHDFAMSIPNTIAFSEAMGFMLQNDDEGFNVPFYITAHEVAHQWWGDQVRGARVKGEGMIVETLSHYSAGIVTLREFGEESMKHIIRHERGRYLKGRKRESDREQPLALSEDQSYIHYGKGLINMMALRHYISEDSVNSALRKIIRDFPGTQKKYPDTEDLLGAFRSVTPDSLQYLITDLFEKIIFLESSVQQATVNQGPAGQYQVTAEFLTEKYESDLEGIAQSVAINDWIEVAIYSENARGEEIEIYRKMHRFDQARTTLNIAVSQNPSRIVIDPSFLLMDRNLDDNERDF